MTVLIYVQQEPKETFGYQNDKTADIRAIQAQAIFTAFGHLTFGKNDNFCNDISFAAPFNQLERKGMQADYLKHYQTELEQAVWQPNAVVANVNYYHRIDTSKEGIVSIDLDSQQQKTLDTMMESYDFKRMNLNEICK